MTTVRFESFQAPLKVCLKLFQFVFGFQSNTTDKVCTPSELLFPHCSTFY